MWTTGLALGTIVGSALAGIILLVDHLKARKPKNKRRFVDRVDGE